MSCWRCALFILLWLAHATPGQEPEKITKLVLPPAGEPTPALKYLLWPDIPQQIPGNAVVHYYRAFSPEWFYGQNQRKTQEKLQAVLQAAPAMPTKELEWVIKTGQIRELELGAHSAYCDWQLIERMRSEGIDILLPDMQSFRQLAVLLAVRARFEIASRHFDQAVATLQTGLKLGHDISQAPLLICTLVGAACAQTQLDQVEALIQTPGAPNLYWALTGLPRPFIDLRTGLGGEKLFLFAEMPLLAEIEAGPFGPAQMKTLTAQFGKLLGRRDQPDSHPTQGKAAVIAAALQGYSLAKRGLLEEGWKAETVEAYPALQIVCIFMLHEFTKARDDIFKWTVLPYWQSATEIRFLMDTLGPRSQDPGHGPFLSQIAPITHVWKAAWQVERRIAALRTIEAIRLHAAANKGRLPATLGDIRVVPIPNDPMSGKSFSYSLEGNHITLIGLAPKNEDVYFSLRYEITFAP